MYSSSWNPCKYFVLYSIITKDITGLDDIARTPGIYKGQFAASLPIGCKDYIIELGSYYKGEGAVMYVRAR